MARGFVGVVGSRELPQAWAVQVAAVVGFFVERGWGIGSGGARGADQFALAAVVAAGAEACRRSVVFLPGASPAGPGGTLGAFVARGGRVVAGAGVGRAALLGRSRRLAQASAGVVAFLWGPSRGSMFTVREAIGSGKPAAVVLAGGDAALPSFASGRWAPCVLAGVAAFRWVPVPEAPAAGEPGPAPTALHRLFVVPDGEPAHALLTHISSLSQGERLWFEQGVLAGETVLVPHEALSDTPAYLALPRLRRRFRCSVREAAGLGELFLGLEAGPDVVAYYEREARRRGVAAVIEELVRLVAQLALVEECAEGNALADAECLGDWAEAVASDERGAALAVQPAELAVAPGADGAFLAWHALGSVAREAITCPACGAVYEDDDEDPDIPTCPACATPDTWEARQGPAFRRLVAEIDGCATLVELAAVGKRLYAIRAPNDQAGVVWCHYHLRKAALEARVTLGEPARRLIAEIEGASSRRLGCLGARLYRLQQGGATAIPAPEWRRVWHPYHVGRRPRAA